MRFFKKRLTMQKKLISIFLLCMVIPTISIFILSMGNLKNGEKTEYELGVEKRITSVANIVDRRMEECISKSDVILTNSFLVKGLMKDYTTDMIGVMEYYNELNMFMAGLGFQSDITSKNSCVIYPMNDSMPPGKYINKLEILKQQKELWEKVETLQEGKFIWDYSHIKETSVNDKYISLFRSVNRYDKNTALLEVRIYLSDLISYLENIPYINGEVVTYMSPDKEIMYANTNNIKTNYDIIHKVQLTDGSNISCMMDKSIMYMKYYRYFGVYLLGFTVVILIVLYLYNTMIMRVTRDLNNFVDSLHNSDYVKIENFSNDPDVELIMKRFNELICKTHKMYEDIAQMNKMKKSMELELLQTGINPHLLYNSLSVLKWRMLRLKQKEMADMIDNMTDYYRRVLSTRDNIISIREELELTEQYIKINEVSYDWSYTLIKDIDEDVLECPVIKLIMQPIVENSILHGLVGKTDAVIRISIKKSDEYILFKIQDNGYGMSEKTLEKALDLYDQPMKRNGYGLKNTIKRIKMYYGEDCGLDMISRIDHGTSVTIKIKNLSETELREHLY